MKRTRSFLGAFFFLCGLGCFSLLPWLFRMEIQRLLLDEPYYRCPVILYSDRALIRNDAFGKGKFGASRGARGQRSHKGIDLLTPVGNPILAAKSGRVTAAGIDKGYGWYVQINHPDGRLTRYAHLTRVFVRVGDWVALGRQVGLCGKSGNADDPRIQPHLHFEIREGDKAIDPIPLFDPSLLVK